MKGETSGFYEWLVLNSFVIIQAGQYKETEEAEQQKLRKDWQMVRHTVKQTGKHSVQADQPSIRRPDIY